MTPFYYSANVTGHRNLHPLGLGRILPVNLKLNGVYNRSRADSKLYQNDSVCNIDTPPAKGRTCSPRRGAGALTPRSRQRTRSGSRSHGEERRGD